MQKPESNDKDWNVSLVNLVYENQNHWYMCRSMYLCKPKIIIIIIFLCVAIANK